MCRTNAKNLLALHAGSTDSQVLVYAVLISLSLNEKCEQPVVLVGEAECVEVVRSQEDGHVEQNRRRDAWLLQPEDLMQADQPRGRGVNVEVHVS